MAKGCSTTWCNHRWRIHSQSGGSLINWKVSAIRPTLPRVKGQDDIQREHKGKKKKKSSCIVYILSKQVIRGFLLQLNTLYNAHTQTWLLSLMCTTLQVFIQRSQESQFFCSQKHTDHKCRKLKTAYKGSQTQNFLSHEFAFSALHLKRVVPNIPTESSCSCKSAVSQRL